MSKTDVYLAEVARARKIAEEASASQIRSGKPATSLGLEVCYALIISSYDDSRGTGIPIPPDVLVEALARLMPYLPREELGYALEMALEMATTAFGEAKAKALTRIARYFPESRRKTVLQEAVRAVVPLHNTEGEQRWLVEFIPWLADRGYVQEAVEAIQYVHSEQERSWALQGMASHLSGAALRDALAMARRIRSGGFSQGHAVAALAIRLAHLSHLEEALITARGIEDKASLVQALSGVALYLPEKTRNEVLGDALIVTQTIQRFDVRAGKLRDLAPHLPEVLLRQALAITQEIDHDGARAEALTGLIPRLAELGYPQEALAAIHNIHKLSQDEALAGLAPHLPEPFLRKALTLAREWEWNSKALAALASRLADLGYLQDAFTTVMQIETELYRAQALTGLASRLPNPLLRQALTASLEMGTECWRAQALTTLIPRLAELGYPQEALATVQGIEEYWQAEVLSRVLPKLAELGYLQESLAAAQTISSNSRRRAEALAGLACYLPESLLAEALAAALEIEWAPSRTEALAEMAPHLAKCSPIPLYSLWRDALHTLSVRTQKDLVVDIGALAPVIVRLGGTEAIVETFRAIRDVGFS